MYSTDRRTELDQAARPAASAPRPLPQALAVARCAEERSESALALARELRTSLLGPQPTEPGRALGRVDEPDYPALLPALEQVADGTLHNLDQLSAVLRDLLDHV